MLDARCAAVYDLRLTPADALTAATKNAACVRNDGAKTGALAKGCRADFCVVDDSTALACRQGEDPMREIVVAGGRAVGQRGSAAAAPAAT